MTNARDSFTLDELDHLVCDRDPVVLAKAAPDLAAFARRLLVECDATRAAIVRLGAAYGITHADAGVASPDPVIVVDAATRSLTDAWAKYRAATAERDALRATVDRLRSALAPPITNLLDFRGTAKLTHYGAPLGWEAARNGPAVCATCGGGCVAYVNNRPSGCKHTSDCAALAQEAALGAYRRRTEPDALRALLADAPAEVPDVG